MNDAVHPAAPRETFDVARIRADFPILAQTIRGKQLVFLDSAASAQKPRAVIDAMRNAMETQYANVHRGLHWMSERTTDAYEAARDAIAGADERARPQRGGDHPQRHRIAQPDGAQLWPWRAASRARRW